jgi:hypothetical protein
MESVTPAAARAAVATAGETFAADPFAAGNLARVNKPGSSHDGYVVKILGITGTGQSYRVSLGNNAVRTYYTENLSPITE